MVETLARYDGSQIITYNMSLYTDASSVSRLMGAAPGLVGFGDVVTLPDAVKAKPKSFVFFDEIEKAHPDLQRTIMQVMDKGVMPDSLNLPVSFKDTIVIFASNVLRESYFKPEEKRDDKIVREKLTAAINPKTGIPFFLPEFIGRIYSVQLFDDVTPAIANMVLHKEIRDINKGVSARGYVVTMDDRDAEKIIDIYFDSTQGGRSIRQLSKNILRPLITQRLLTRQATETNEEDGDLKPMVLKIDGRAICIDGHTLESDMPPAVRPQRVFSFKNGAASTLAGGQK
jgi:ATP-dependent Clp protease ATP-binding subunit ClpA